jgi:hypothetical protein
MPQVGNLRINTYVMAGNPGSRTKTTTVGANSISPSHVIEIYNPTTLRYTVKVSGHVVGNPSKLEFFGSKSVWSSSVQTVLSRRRQYPDEPLKRNGRTGPEDLECDEVIEQSSHATSEKAHSNLGISVAITVA